jgi:hypothetical protein
MRSLTCVSLGLLGAGVIQASAAQAITTWTWSFTTEISDQFGSGTFTTADVTPAPGVFFSVIGIHGTYNRNGISYSISGLSGAFGATNNFQWDGTTISPMILTGGGISFEVGSDVVNLYNGLGLGHPDLTYSSFSGRNGGVTSSKLTPVPGPLPLLGVAAAYRWTRTLRRRTTTLG